MNGFTEMRGEAVLPWMALAAFFMRQNENCSRLKLSAGLRKPLTLDVQFPVVIQIAHSNLLSFQRFLSVIGWQPLRDPFQTICLVGTIIFQ